MDRYLIAVHVGAGHHSKRKEDGYKAVMARACDAAARCLKNDEGLLASVSAAIAGLEDSPLTNAGNGSNLNLNGCVECDASIMTDMGVCGSVAAAAGLENPIKVAAALAERSQDQLSLGRVPPIMLAGDGARLWASQHGVQPLLQESRARQMHVTESSRAKFEKYSAMIAAHETPEMARGEESVLLDTVGCVVVDSQGRVAAGVSSGGIAMKFPGRVGEASILGAGTWASCDGIGTSVGCSVTGVGERITKHLIAKRCCDTVLMSREEEKYDMSPSVCGDVSKLLDGAMSQEPFPRDCGVLLAESHKVDGSVGVTLTASFTASSSFGIGYLISRGNGDTCRDQRILRSTQPTGDGDTSRSASEFQVGATFIPKNV